MQKEDSYKEFRQMFILSAFLAVFPLIFFPKYLKTEVNPLFLLPFEFIWYLLVYFFLFPLLNFSLILIYSFFSFLLRITIGFVFGVLISFMFSYNLLLSLKLGVLAYLPSILFQIVLLPFIFKFSFGDKIFKLEREKRLERSKPLPEVKEEAVPLHPKAEVKEGTLENALSYLKEYSGVEGAFLVDSEGLIVGQESEEGLEGEKIAPLALSLEEANFCFLKKIGESRADRIQLFTSRRWITLNRVLDFTLVTIASRNTDELLNIRIIRAAEMLKKFIKEKYGKLLGSEEEKNVSDLRGT
jgi:predicted regulator of Ras-like GTPase activity (Roadblock/LC7/MglB family)